MSKQIHYIMRDLAQAVKDGVTKYIDASHFTKQDNKGSIENLEAAFPKGFISDLANKAIAIPRNNSPAEIAEFNRWNAEMSAVHGRNLERNQVDQAPIVPTRAERHTESEGALDAARSFVSYRGGHTPKPPKGITIEAPGGQPDLDNLLWSSELTKMTKSISNDLPDAEADAAHNTGITLVQVFEDRVATLRREVEAAENGVSQFESDKINATRIIDQTRAVIAAIEDDIEDEKKIMRDGYDQYEDAGNNAVDRSTSIGSIREALGLKEAEITKARTECDAALAKAELFDAADLTVEGKELPETSTDAPTTAELRQRIAEAGELSATSGPEAFRNNLSMHRRILTKSSCRNSEYRATWRF
jgi:hypothetical protein